YRIDRLANEPVEARAQDLLVAVATRVRGDCDHRQLSACLPLHRPDLTEQPESVLFRHGQIAEHEVRAILLDRLQAFARRVRHHHGGAAELERDAHHVERVDMVVDDENSQAGKVHVQTCPAQAVGIGEKESRAEFANATAESGGESFTYTKSRDRASVDAASRRAKSMVGELVEERTVADAQELGGV